MAENVSQETDQYGHLEKLIAEMRNTISQQGQVIASLQQNQALPPETASQSTNESAIKKLSKFRKFAPSPFKETKELAEAEEWLDELEGVLEILKTEEEDKIIFTEFMLQGEARVWWKMEKQKLAGKEYVWKDYQELFLHGIFRPVNVNDENESFYIFSRTR